MMVKEHTINDSVVGSFRVGVSPIIQRRCKRVCCNLTTRLRWLQNHHSKISQEKVLSINNVVWIVLIFLMVINGLIFIRVLTYGERIFDTDHIRHFHQLSPNQRGRCAPGYELTPKRREYLSPAGIIYSLIYNFLFRLITGKSVFSCSACKRGSYRDRAQSLSCRPCNPGYYQDKEGSETCKPCPTGTYQNSIAAFSCKKCELGFFQPHTGQTACVKSPESFYQTKESVDSNENGEQEDMLNCDTEYFCNRKLGVHEVRNPPRSCLSGRRTVQEDQKHQEQGIFADFSPYCDVISEILNKHVEAEGRDNIITGNFITEKINFKEVNFDKTLMDFDSVNHDSEDDGDESIMLYSVINKKLVSENRELTGEKESGELTEDQGVDTFDKSNNLVENDVTDDNKIHSLHPDGNCDITAKIIHSGGQVCSLYQEYLTHNNEPGLIDGKEDVKKETPEWNNDNERDNIVNHREFVIEPNVMTVVNVNASETNMKSFNFRERADKDFHKSRLIYKKQQRKNSIRILRNNAIKINRIVSHFKEPVSTAMIYNNNDNGRDSSHDNIKHGIDIIADADKIKNYRVNGNNHDSGTKKVDIINIDSSSNFKNKEVLKSDEESLVAAVVESDINPDILLRVMNDNKKLNIWINDNAHVAKQLFTVRPYTDFQESASRVCDLQLLHLVEEIDSDKIVILMSFQFSNWSNRMNILIEKEIPVFWLPVILSGLLCMFVVLGLSLKLIMFRSVNCNVYTFLYLFMELAFLGSLLTLEDKISSTNYFITLSIVLLMCVQTFVFKLLDYLQRVFTKSLSVGKVLTCIVLSLCVVIGAVLNMDCDALFARKYQAVESDNYFLHVIYSLRLITFPFLLIKIESESKKSKLWIPQGGQILQLVLEIVKGSVLVYNILNDITLSTLVSALSFNVSVSSIQVLISEQFITMGKNNSSETINIKDNKESSTPKDIFSFLNSSSNEGLNTITIEKSELLFDRGRDAKKHDIIIYQNKCIVEEMVSFNSTSECKLYLAHMARLGTNAVAINRDFERTRSDPGSSCGSSDDFIMVPKIFLNENMSVASAENCFCIETGLSRKNNRRRRYKSADSLINESSESKDLDMLVDEEKDVSGTDDSHCKSSMVFMSHNVNDCYQCRKTKL